MLLLRRRLGTQLARGGRPNHLEINNQILACTTSSQLAELVQHGSSSCSNFNEVNVCTALTRLARLQQHPAGIGRSQGNALSSAFDALLLRSSQQQFSPRHLSNLCYAIATTTTTIPAHIATQARAKSTEFAPQGLANVLWSLATIKQKNPAVDGDGSLSVCMADAVAGCTAQFNAQDVANSLWAMGALNLLHEPAIARLAKDVGRLRGQFTPQHLCNMAWALAVLPKVNDGVPPALEEELAQQILQQLDKFSGQDLGICAWAFAQLDSRLLCAGVEAQLCKRPLNTLPASALSKITMSMAKLSYNNTSDDVAWQKAVVNEAVERRRLKGFSPHDTANLCYALSSLGLISEELTRVVLDHVSSLSNVDDYNAQDLTQLAWAFANNGASAAPKRDKMFLWIAGRVAKLLERQQAKTALFAPQDLSTLVWAFSKVAVADNDDGIKRRMLHKIAVEVLLRRKTLSDFSPHSLATLAWGLASLLPANANVLVFQAIASEVIVRRRNENGAAALTFSDQDVSMLLWAFATADFRDAGLLDAMLDGMVKSRLRRAKAGGDKWASSAYLCNVLWASALLNAGDAELVDLVCEEIVKRGEQHQLSSSEHCTVMWSVACMDMLALESARRVFDCTPSPSSSSTEDMEDSVGKAQLAMARLAWTQTHGKGGLPRALANAANGDAANTHDDDGFHRSSSTHQLVARTLQSLLPSVAAAEGKDAVIINEATLLGCLVVDLYLPKMQLVIEVDGPFHYFANTLRAKTGKTMFKHRLLQRAGFHVHSLPAVEFERLTARQQRDMLREILLQ